MMTHRAFPSTAACCALSAPYRGVAGLGAGSAAAGTLDTVRQRGSLTAASARACPGFSDRDGAGEWSGFDVDFCRAVAAADLRRRAQGDLRAALRRRALRRAADRRDRPPRRATRPGRWIARRGSASSSPASPIMTARASWCRAALKSPRRSSSTAPRSASRPARRPSSTSPIISARTR